MPRSGRSGHTGFSMTMKARSDARLFVGSGPSLKNGHGVATPLRPNASGRLRTHPRDDYALCRSTNAPVRCVVAHNAVAPFAISQMPKPKPRTT